MASPLATLFAWATAGELSNCKVSDDGTSLSNGSIQLDAKAQIDVEKDGKSCSYTIASIFLQILDPNQGLMAYRNACKKYDVKDPVKALDKPTVVGYFGAEEEGGVTETAVDPTPAVADESAKEPMDEEEARKLKEYKDRKHAHKDRKREQEKKQREKEKEHRKRDRDDPKHRSKDDKKEREERPPPPKRPKMPMTNEQVVANLSTVVDKREDGDHEMSEVHKALSAEGFDVTPELIKESKIDHIVNYEIPVGNSASILRPAPGRDLSRVLQLYQDVKDKASNNKAKPNSSGSAPLPSSKQYLVGKKPIIILPKGMTAPLTLVNAHEFFGNSNFVPRDKMLQVNGRNPPQTVFTHTMDNRNGGGMVEFELMDNPKVKLGGDPKEWERIVAVVTLGASWQFKDWPREYSDPVKLFQKVKGFYPSMVGDKIPVELQGWRVIHGKFNRDKRGLDSVCWANFWKDLEEFMAVHKREMLPRIEV